MVGVIYFIECSLQELCVLEDLADLLSPFKQASEYLSGEKYPIISAVGPLLSVYITTCIISY